MEWKPIESAPKDGTVILVCAFTDGGGPKDYGRMIGSARFLDGGWWWESEGNAAWPAYWMPLPPDPRPEEE